MSNTPETQHALQLVGPDRLTVNNSKKVHTPGPHQLLCQVEAVGLCFSDLKLLKQFSSHARKSKIISGIEPEILEQIPSYVPDEKPTVPGHESVVRIVSIGPGVENFKPGQRFLVQTDYRWLPTANSNASYGYNFEGGLQEFVLMDERVITSPQGQSMLIPVSEELCASAVALIEPWACVEDAYACRERQKLKANGQMLIVADAMIPDGLLDKLFDKYGKVSQITWLSKSARPLRLDVPLKQADSIESLADAAYDDVIYFGSAAETAEALFAKVAPKGLYNIVLCGGKFDRNIVTMVGRVHYGGIRLIGTTGSDPSDAMEYIPATGEIRTGDKINVIGAAGPMGLMHIIRDICQGIKDITVFAGDLDDERLAILTKIALPFAEKNNVTYKPYNPRKDRIDEDFDYITVMVPVPALVAAAVTTAAKQAVINIFAGIPANVTGQIDLNCYIEKQLYFIGTSGSVLEDMKTVLAKVESGRLDTNVSVAAVCGLENATEGIRAVEKQLIAGKILVYPACRDLPLTKLQEMPTHLPKVGKLLDNGLWTKQAEEQLLKIYQGP
jgi:threonine dehydrogenase-like Zn-dependent dehydrogenase